MDYIGICNEVKAAVSSHDDETEELNLGFIASGLLPQVDLQSITTPRLYIFPAGSSGKRDARKREVNKITIAAVYLEKAVQDTQKNAALSRFELLRKFLVWHEFDGYDLESYDIDLPGAEGLNENNLFEARLTLTFTTWETP